MNGPTRGRPRGGPRGRVKIVLDKIRKMWYNRAPAKEGPIDLTIDTDFKGMVKRLDDIILNLITIRLIHASNNMHWAKMNGDEGAYDKWWVEFAKARDDYYEERRKKDEK